MIDWKKLCFDSHQISVEKGWQEKPRTYHEDTDLFHSEVSEALEDYRSNHKLDEFYYENRKKDPLRTTAEGLAAMTDEERHNQGIKPCGIPVELADTLIRFAQFSGTHKLDLAYAMERVRVAPSDTLPELLAKVHMNISDAYTYWLDTNEYNVNILSLAAKRIVDFCNINKIPLERALAVKEAFNRLRPYLHGGKKI